MTTTDRKGSTETVVYDSDTGKQVASDIKFRHKSTIHLSFDADGTVKAIDRRDKDGNVRHWKRDAQDRSEATVERSQNEFTGLKKMEIKFNDGSKVHLDLDSQGNLSSLYTVDQRKNISHLQRR